MLLRMKIMFNYTLALHPPYSLVCVFVFCFHLLLNIEIANRTLIEMISLSLGGHGQGGSRSYFEVRFQPVDAHNLQVGQDIQLQCAVHGSIQRPYEYTYTKDGQPLAHSKHLFSRSFMRKKNKSTFAYNRCRSSPRWCFDRS